MSSTNPELNKLSWEELRFHLLHELERTSNILEALDKKVDVIVIKQETFEAKAKVLASLFGFATGSIPVLLKIFWDLVTHK